MSIVVPLKVSLKFYYDFSDLTLEEQDQLNYLMDTFENLVNSETYVDRDLWEGDLLVALKQTKSHIIKRFYKIQILERACEMLA